MLVETDIRGILLGLEKKRADLRYALKDCICVPVALRDHVKIHLIAEELELLRTRIRGLKKR